MARKKRPRVVRTPEEVIALILSRSVQDGQCLRFQGYIDRDGYGQFRYKGKLWRVSRLLYILAKGDIPLGFVVDHVDAKGCRWRDCVNLDHLESVTNRENLRRGRRIPKCTDQRTLGTVKTMCLEREAYGVSTRLCLRCRTLRALLK